MKDNLGYIFVMFFIFIFVFHVSCTNNNRSSDNMQQKIFLNEKPVIFDSTSIMSYSADELIRRNGKPVSDIIFPINQADPSNDVLWHYLSRDSGIHIREQKWELDSINYVVIWFTEQDSIWKPVLFDFRDVLTDY